MKIVARQKLGLTLLQPLARLSSMTFRTGAVAAAVITPERLAQSSQWYSRPPSSAVQQAAMSARARLCEGIICGPYCDR